MLILILTCRKMIFKKMILKDSVVQCVVVSIATSLYEQTVCWMKLSATSSYPPMLGQLNCKTVSLKIFKPELKPVNAIHENEHAIIFFKSNHRLVFGLFFHKVLFKCMSKPEHQIKNSCLLFLRVLFCFIL